MQGKLMMRGQRHWIKKHWKEPNSALKAPFNPKYPTIVIIGNILFTFRTIFIALLKDNSALKAHSARFAHS